MPRFSANISMLFREVEFPERFEAAAQAGFKAVEIQFPYGWSRRQLGEIAQHAGVEVVLINIPARRLRGIQRHDRASKRCRGRPSRDRPPGY